MSNYGYMSRTGVVGAGELIYAMMEMLGYSEDLALVLERSPFVQARWIPRPFIYRSTPKTLARTASAPSSSAPPRVSSTTRSTTSMKSMDRWHTTMPTFTRPPRAPVPSSTGRGSRSCRPLRTPAEDSTTSRSTSSTASICTRTASKMIPLKNATPSSKSCFTERIAIRSTDPSTGQISPPDSASIQSFFGAQLSGSTWIKVPEKLLPGPDGNWYRRATPLTTAEIGGDAAITYLAHAVPFGANDGTRVNSFTPSAQQFNGTGVGAFCLVLNQLITNPGVLSQRFGLFVIDILAVVATLVAPARATMSC